MLQKQRKSRRRSTRPVGKRWFRWAVLAGASGTAGLAITLASALTWPALATPVTLAAQHEQRADAALGDDGGAQAAFSDAARENNDTIARAPSTASAWLRAAYIRQQATGALDATSLRDLETSYRMAPLGPGVTRWRLRFVFENWQQVTPRTRASAIEELRVFASYNSGSRALVDSFENPAGRLAAKLIVRQVYLDVASRKPNTSAQPAVT